VRPWILSLSKAFLLLPVPPILRRRFILPWRRSLPEFLATSRPSGLPAGPTSLSFPVPSTASPWSAPYEVGRPVPPRFRSQVFSTSQRFPSRPGFHGLIACRNRSWDSSLQSFPLAGIARPSRGHLLPCRCPPTCWDATPGALSLPVSPTSTLSHAVAWFPRRLWAPFHAPGGTLPGHPGPRAAEPSRSASFTDFEALILLRVRSRRHRLPRTDGRYSPGFLPLWSVRPPRLGSCDPSSPEGLDTHPRPETRARDTWDLATPGAR
jgi:hypothetical protein